MQKKRRARHTYVHLLQLFYTKQIYKETCRNQYSSLWKIGWHNNEKIIKKITKNAPNCICSCPTELRSDESNGLRATARMYSASAAWNSYGVGMTNSDREKYWTMKDEFDIEREDICFCTLMTGYLYFCARKYCIARENVRVEARILPMQWR